MKKLVVALVALTLVTTFAATAMAQNSGVRWQGPYKGPGTTFKSTGRGTPVTKPGYSSYRYNTSSPTPRPIPFQSIRSADPGSYRSTQPPIAIPPSGYRDHR